MNAAANLLIATCLHRLEQLTHPTFDRQTVEALLDEIAGLRKQVTVEPNELAERLAELEADVAHRDRLIEIQQECMRQSGEQATVIAQLRRINRELAEANAAQHAEISRLHSSRPAPKIPLGLQPGPSQLWVPHPNEAPPAKYPVPSGMSFQRQKS